MSTIPVTNKCFWKFSSYGSVPIKIAPITNVNCTPRSRKPIYRRKSNHNQLQKIGLASANLEFAKKYNLQLDVINLNEDLFQKKVYVQSFSSAQFSPLLCTIYAFSETWFEQPYVHIRSSNRNIYDTKMHLKLYHLFHLYGAQIPLMIPSCPQKMKRIKTFSGDYN